MADGPPKVELRGVSAWYGDTQALTEVDLSLPAGQITALVGTIESGKTSVLRLVNRLCDEDATFGHSGEVWLDDERVSGPEVDVVALRRRCGMLFGKPSAFPGSIFENVAIGLGFAGLVDRRLRAVRVEAALRAVGMWDSMRGELNAPAATVSASLRQRLCLARALALDPDVLLLDEPTLRLHPAAAAEFEAVIAGLAGQRTVLVATRDAQLAGRIADVTAFIDRGRVIEVGPTDELFTNPREPATQAYISGRFAR